MKLAYLTARFPSISETFVLHEMIEMEKLGAEIELFALVHQDLDVKHPESRRFEGTAHFSPLFSRPVLGAQLRWLRRRPLVYLRAVARALWGNRASPKFLSRALVATPQAARFAEIMQETGVEHIHAHWAHHATLAAYVANRLTGIPYSFTGHANDIFVDQTMLSDKIAAAEFMVTISEFNRDFLRGVVGDELAARVEVIHCGVDTGQLLPGVPGQLSDPFRVLCVARLHEKKGQRHLVDAVAQLRSAGREIVLTLVGDGEERAEVEAQIRRLGLGDEVELTGRLPHEKVVAQIRRCDVLVLPSVITAAGRMEGIPVALMEAMACGVPVVATELSGVPELVEDGETGLLVPQGDSQALVGAIERLLSDDDLRARVALNGRRRVEEQFDLSRNSRMLYQRIARCQAGDDRPRLSEPYE